MLPEPVLISSEGLVPYSLLPKLTQLFVLCPNQNFGRNPSAMDQSSTGFCSILFMALCSIVTWSLLLIFSLVFNLFVHDMMFKVWVYVPGVFLCVCDFSYGLYASIWSIFTLGSDLN